MDTNRTSRPSLDEQVVVVTGASNGIGRETALELSRRGAAVVSGARNEEALATLAEEVRGSGGRIETVTTDVGEYDQVEALGRTAIDRFGRVDTWINNAGVSVYATVDETQPDEMERVVRVNLLGVMFGSKVAAALMRPRGSGTIVNVGSVLSDRAVPLQSSYVASKHGVAGFSEAFRLELERDQSGIDVVLVQPSSINTPLFENARSRLGVLPMPVPPVYQPSVVAEALCHVAEHGGRNVVVGGAGKLLTLAQWLSPSLTDRYMLNRDRGATMQETDQPDDRRDNLFQPSTGPGSTTGQFGAGAMGSSVYTRHLELHPGRKRAAVAAALIGAVALVRRAGR